MLYQCKLCCYSLLVLLLTGYYRKSDEPSHDECTQRQFTDEDFQYSGTPLINTLQPIVCTCLYNVIYIYIL